VGKSVVRQRGRGLARDTIPSVKRRVMLTNIFAGLSLILALACGWLWARSYFVGDLFIEHHRGWGAGNCPGVIYLRWAAPANLQWTAPDSSALKARDGWTWVEIPPNSAKNLYDVRGEPGGVTFAGFSYVRSTMRSKGFLLIAFPHWSLLLALLVFPALRGWQLLRARRRQNENLCPQCGYDLRATPQRCPECGRENDMVTSMAR
jgi:hypothetical protein